MMDSSPLTMTWVLCSTYVDDIVILCPEGIYYPPIEGQYPYPTVSQILRNFFKNT